MESKVRKLEWKNTLSFLLVFIIAFALGYLIDAPNEIEVNFNIDDNALQMTENMKNLTYNCPSCVCKCETNGFGGLSLP